MIMKAPAEHYNGVWGPTVVDINPALPKIRNIP